VAGLSTFCAGLAAVGVATCALSYAGLHAIAQQGGIQAHYARGYPLLIDAMLVIALAAVLTLRGAGMPSRVLSWATLLVLLVAAAGAEALHATGRRLPRDAAAITVTVLPWLLMLLIFVLLLAMLRHARLRQPAGTTGAAQAHPAVHARDRNPPPPAAAAPLPVRTPQPWNSAPIVPGLSARLVSAAAAGAAAGAAAAEKDDADTQDDPPEGSGQPTPAEA